MTTRVPNLRMQLPQCTLRVTGSAPVLISTKYRPASSSQPKMSPNLPFTSGLLTRSVISTRNFCTMPWRDRRILRRLSSSTSYRPLAVSQPSTLAALPSCARCSPPACTTTFVPSGTRNVWQVLPLLPPPWNKLPRPPLHMPRVPVPICGQLRLPLCVRPAVPSRPKLRLSLVQDRGVLKLSARLAQLPPLRPPPSSSEPGKLLPKPIGLVIDEPKDEGVVVVRRAEGCVGSLAPGCEGYLLAPVDPLRTRLLCGCDVAKKPAKGSA
mmetsp:Transcript_100701/g.260107  ORF Transcript_100701/g.260107 Transcript_100701/m.260107 type:complete len:267 (+) Transcript_100701:223-1023(+)